MSGLRSRIRRLEQRGGPGADDPLGLRDLDYGEMQALDRLLTAWCDGEDVAVIGAKLAPTTARKFEMIFSRVQQFEGSDGLEAADHAT